MSFLISIDPGKNKCGILLADTLTNNVLEAGISSSKNFLNLISVWSKIYLIEKIIIGNGTNCNNIEKDLKQNNFHNLHFVNEEGSTLRARFRYWEIWPPSYFISWLPRELLFPPDKLDAIVALILLEDFLSQRLFWPKKVNIRTWP